MFMLFMLFSFAQRIVRRHQFRVSQVATRAQNLANEAVSHGVTSMPKLRESDVHLTPVNEAWGLPARDFRKKAMYSYV